jgi:hypothetical protein
MRNSQRQLLTKQVGSGDLNSEPIFGFQNRRRGAAIKLNAQV